MCRLHTRCPPRPLHSDPPATRLLLPTDTPIQPVDLWPTLTPAQQQELLQTLVRICRTLLVSPTPLEVPHDST
jgi:hypothetical protein